MTLFGIGTLELILILLLLILIFGPERIAEMGMWLGRTYKKITGISAEINQQVSTVRKSVNAELDLPKVENPIKQVTAELDSLKKGLVQDARPATQVAAELKSVKSEIDRQVQGATPTIGSQPEPSTPTTEEKEQAS